MNYKVSVIIPCYNVESTIERAITSIINQSLGFENIEVILYDDASTDNTKKYITEYSRKYDNIVPIFSKINQGPGKGRNECIKKVSSKYIMFLDSDDEYDADMCKKLYSEINLNKQDLVFCNYMDIDNIENHEIKFEYLPEKAVLNNEYNVVFNSQNVFYVDNILIWNCIFKRDIIIQNNILFPDLRVAEDSYFTLMYKLNSFSISYLKNYVGVYRHVQKNSLSNSLSFDNLIKMHGAQLELFNELEQYDLDLGYIFKRYIRGSLIRLYISDYLDSQKKSDIIDFLKKIHDFEIKINFDYSLGLPLNILNYLIMHQQYDVSVIYLHLLKKIFNFNILRKLYRIFLN